MTDALPFAIVSSRGVRPSNSRLGRIIHRDRLTGPPGKAACRTFSSGSVPVVLSGVQHLLTRVGKDAVTSRQQLIRDVSKRDTLCITERGADNDHLRTYRPPG